MAPIYKKKQRRQLAVAVVCSILVFALLLATAIIGLMHRASLAAKFEDEMFASAIAQAMNLSSRYDLKQEDLDQYEGLVYFWDIGIDSTSGSTYAYPIVMLCDKEYTDELILRSDPDYEAPEDEEEKDFSEHYKAVLYAPTEPEDLNLFPNLRLLRTFDMAELNEMDYQCWMTQYYSSMTSGYYQAAYLEQIIEDARMTKLTSLEQLSKLTKLEQISLCYTGLTELKGIENFPNLTKLDASYTALSDVTGLDTATKLTYLGLNSLNVKPAEKAEDNGDEITGETSDKAEETDGEETEEEEEEEKEKVKEKEAPLFNENGLTTEGAAMIAKMPGLVYLDISNNNVSDLSALSALQNVKFLNAGNNPVASLSGVENMKALERLDASNCLLADAKALTGLENLETVILSNNLLTDLSALSAATKVTYLNASDNMLTDASGVSGMTEMESLYLYDNLLVAAPDLSKMTKATAVDLSDNCMTDASGLAKFNPTGFDDEDSDGAPTVTLNLSQNKLEEVTLTATMLTSLNLSDNKLTALELRSCKSIASLNISKNKELESVPSLSRLAALTTLTASETGLTELVAIKKLEKLTTVDLSKSAIKSLDGLRDNESITTLNLSECKDLTDIRMLCTITGLTSVNFSKCTGLTDESIAGGFGTVKTDDQEAKLRFPEKHELTVNLTGCTGVKDYKIFDEYSEMKVTHDEKK